MKPEVYVTNQQWQMAVRNLLTAGYGAEDIALMTEATPARVRAEIAFLRDAGWLERLRG